MSRIIASLTMVSETSGSSSYSLASRRQRPSQASVRSATQRRGSRTKPSGHRQVDAGEDKEAPSLIGATALCGSLDARDLSPDREGLHADGSVLAGGEVIAVEIKEVVDLVVGGEERNCSTGGEDGPAG